MNISLIAAMAKNRVIGLNQKMPWHLPADLQHFRRATLNKPVIMGRKTWESIGHPLPKRRNIVITRQTTLPNPQPEIYHTLADALKALATQDEVMIIGGQMLFETAIPIANRLYITEIDLCVTGDTFFPAWNTSEWELIDEVSHQKDEHNPYPYRFKHYLRKSSDCNSSRQTI